MSAIWHVSCFFLVLDEMSFFTRKKNVHVFSTRLTIFAERLKMIRNLLWILVSIPMIVHAGPPQPDSDDLYARLGLSKNASPSEIRGAYYFSFHDFDPISSYDPKSPEHLRVSVSRLAEAYIVLSHPKTRKEYDSTGKIDVIEHARATGTMSSNLYERLGIDSSSSPDEVKDAATNLLVRLYSNIWRSKDLKPEIKAVEDARDVLTDPRRRSLYDLTGEYIQDAPTMKPKAPIRPAQKEPSEKAMETCCVGSGVSNELGPSIPIILNGWQDPNASQWVDQLDSHLRLAQTAEEFVRLAKPKARPSQANGTPLDSFNQWAVDHAYRNSHDPVVIKNLDRFMKLDGWQSHISNLDIRDHQRTPILTRFLEAATSVREYLGILQQARQWPYAYEFADPIRDTIDQFLGKEPNLTQVNELLANYIRSLTDMYAIQQWEVVRHADSRRYVLKQVKLYMLSRIKTGREFTSMMRDYGFSFTLEDLDSILKLPDSAPVTDLKAMEYDFSMPERYVSDEARIDFLRKLIPLAKTASEYVEIVEPAFLKIPSWEAALNDKARKGRDRWDTQETFHFKYYEEQIFRREKPEFLKDLNKLVKGTAKDFSRLHPTPEEINRLNANPALSYLTRAKIVSTALKGVENSPLSVDEIRAVKTIYQGEGPIVRARRFRAGRRTGAPFWNCVKLLQTSKIETH